jgi:hypothetical protein
VAAHIAPEVLEEPDVEEFDEPIHYPAENALPDAPVHHSVAPDSLPETTPIADPIKDAAPPPLPEEYVAAHSAVPAESGAPTEEETEAAQ